MHRASRALRKLTDEDIEEIRGVWLPPGERHGPRRTLQDLAIQYGVSVARIHNIQAEARRKWLREQRQP